MLGTLAYETWALQPMAARNPRKLNAPLRLKEPWKWQQMVWESDAASGWGHRPQSRFATTSGRTTVKAANAIPMGGPSGALHSKTKGLVLHSKDSVYNLLSNAGSGGLNNIDKKEVELHSVSPVDLRTLRPAVSSVADAIQTIERQARVDERREREYHLAAAIRWEKHLNQSLAQVTTDIWLYTKRFDAQFCI